MKPNSTKPQPPQSLQSQLDMSSIDDGSQQQYDDSSSLDIQEMGLDGLPDEKQFRDGVRELLATERMDFQHHQEEVQAEGQPNDEGQFDGQPLKGSFLREMERLGKTMSFQSTAYNIYQGCEDTGNVLSSLTPQKGNITAQMLKFMFGLRNLESNTMQIQAKYIVDFSKAKGKPKKQNSKCKNTKKSQNSSKKMFTDAQNSTKSMSNFLDRPFSLASIKKNKTKNQSSRRSPKNNQQDQRKSQFSAYVGKIKKISNSPLRKVGYNSSTVSQVLKTKQMDRNQFVDRALRRKKIQQKINNRTKL